MVKDFLQMAELAHRRHRNRKRVLIHIYKSFRWLKIAFSLLLTVMILLVIAITSQDRSDEFIDAEMRLYNQSDVRPHLQDDAEMVIGGEPPSTTIDKIYIPGFQITNEELCPNLGENLLVMIIVSSAPMHWEQRLTIRNTWGNANIKRHNVSVAYLIGKDSNYMMAIEEENGRYGDIIQTHSLDTYNNLTLKTLSMLEWGRTYCHKVKFFLKADDDVFINVPQLIQYARTHILLSRTIVGRVSSNSKVVTNKKSKYYVKTNEIYYPNFTVGPAYMLTSDIVNELFIAALNRNYFKLEDVFLTGYIADDLGITRISLPMFINKRPPFQSCFVQNYISFHRVTAREQYILWKLLYTTASKCYKYIKYV